VAAGRARGSRPRRVSLPGVAELLRPVGPGLASDFGRQASGRESHPQKITVYLSADEFLDLERARLTLRAHGIGADRGRLVREAIALLMTDLEAGIDASVIAKRLRAASQPDPADDVPVANGAPADGGAAEGARSNGGVAVSVLVGGPPNGPPVDGGSVHGVPAIGGPVHAVRGVPAIGGSAGGVLGANGVLGGGPVVGVLANGAGVTGPPEGPQ
jgi:hypothetical protein